MSVRLAVRSVDYSYPGGSRVLDGVELDVGPGDLVALVGANGSGKSTLLRLVAGLRAPDAGTVRLGEDLVHALDARERARRVAFLPQGVHPVHALTAREIVALGRHPHRTSAWSGETESDARAIDAALEACDVTAFAPRAFDTLSGGERQRVLIAGAIAQGGEMLVLDEPTAALDLPHQIAVFDLLRAQARAGTGVLLATHDLNLAAAFADHIVLLDGGRVLAQGTPDVVIRRDVLGSVLGEGIWIGPHPVTAEPCVLPWPEGERS
mgnify:CR=1 FL=1